MVAQMDDYRIDYDFDEYEMDFYQLIDELIADIKHLESKVVRLRYLLSGFLPEHDGKMLKCEIFSDLAGSYYSHPAYQQYVAKYCDGHDPMDSTNYVKHMMKLSHGDESVDL
jgi:hypothetical protein